MCEITEEGKGRRVRATESGERRGYKRVAGSFYRVTVALFLAAGVARGVARIGTSEDIERDATPYCRSSNGRRRLAIGS